MSSTKRHLLACAAAFALGSLSLAQGDDAPEPGAVGGSGLALRTAKALVVPPDMDARQVVDNAIVLIKDGKIERVGRAGVLAVPDGYAEIDVGERWVMPGLVELHCHVAGVFDINDMVYLTNPGISSRTDIRPNNDALKTGLAAGVTTVLYIPGSGTNIGGGGVLLKTGPKKYEDALLRDPGSMKLAQWGNPEGWTVGVGMSFEHFNTRNTLRRGVAYAERWEAFEEGNGPEPERNIQFDIFRKLIANEAQISTHTQMYQVVLMTITMVRGEFGLPVFLDHSSVGGWLTAPLCREMGVPAIVGPRSLDPASRGMINWARNKHEGMRGLAAGYQQYDGGTDMIGFNTDSPVIPQEELQLQAGMAVRYGLRDNRLAAVRGLTVVPAMTTGIADRVGNLMPGRDADILVISGHPADPRSSVEMVLIDGKKMYDTSEDKRRW